VIAQPKIQWRMSTAYPAASDILHGAAQRLAKMVDEQSGGRFRIEVFPNGQILQPFECFDAASQGRSRPSWPSPPTGPGGSPRWSGSRPFRSA
jgi:TRAP-type mannitol/chloroaromatic compound transport system substrate-binding protein